MTSNFRIALLKALDAIGDYVMPESTLYADVNIRLSVPITHTQFRQLLSDEESKRRIVSQQSEDGVKWKITDNGRARLAELI